MSSAILRALGGVLPYLACGCSFGAFQTAHTQAPASVSFTPGIANIWNGLDKQAGRGLETNIGGQLGARVGIAPRLDVGVGTFLYSGAKADVKVNLLEPHQRLAIAPRLGAGYRFERRVAMAEGGAIVSYRFLGGHEPYLGLSFANHWIEPQLTTAPVPPNAVGRRGTGDGLLQLNLGIEIPITRHSAMLLEYGHWFPLNDDPGDFYAFVPTNIAGIALRIGSVQP